MTKAKPIPIKGKGGRPSKYKYKYAKELIDFFDVEAYKKETMEKTTEYFASGDVKKESEKFKLVPNKLPTLFRFSREIGVSKPTVLAWTKARIGTREKDLTNKKDTRLLKYPEFLSAYNAIKDMQKEFLIELGLAGASPPASFIFVAKNVTDMRDKIEVPVDDKGNPVTGFVILPQRMSPKDAEKEYNKEDENPPINKKTD